MKKYFILISSLFLSWNTIGSIHAGDDNGTAPPIRGVDSPLNKRGITVQSKTGIIQINFTQAYDNITIMVYDPTGSPVYQNNISIISGDMLKINTSSWNGLYSLEIVDQQGNPIYVNNIECQ